MSIQIDDNIPLSPSCKWARSELTQAVIKMKPGQSIGGLARSAANNALATTKRKGGKGACRAELGKTYRTELGKTYRFWCLESCKEQ